MTQLIVGVAYEGSVDAAYIEGLITKLFTGFNKNLHALIPARAGTVITKFVPVYAAKFRNERCDIMIFLTDGDGGKNTKVQITEKLESVDPSLIETSAIGVPEPHLEKWILADENAVKNIFSLNGSSPIPHQDLKPKERLIALYGESSFKGTLDDAKLSILSISGLDVMRKNCSDFNAFYQDLSRVFNTMENQLGLLG